MLFNNVGHLLCSIRSYGSLLPAAAVEEKPTARMSTKGQHHCLRSCDTAVAPKGGMQLACSKPVVSPSSQKQRSITPLLLFYRCTLGFCDMRKRHLSQIPLVVSEFQVELGLESRGPRCHSVCRAQIEVRVFCFCANLRLSAGLIFRFVSLRSLAGFKLSVAWFAAAAQLDFKSMVVMLFVRVFYILGFRGGRYGVRQRIPQHWRAAQY